MKWATNENMTIFCKTYINVYKLLVTKQVKGNNSQVTNLGVPIHKTLRSLRSDIRLMKKLMQALEKKYCCLNKTCVVQKTQI